MENTLKGFAKLEDSGKFLAIAKTSSPSIDGYDITMAETGWPYHVHPTATPEEWNKLQNSIIKGHVQIVSWAEPISSKEDRIKEINLNIVSELDGTDGLVARHRDEKEFSKDTSLTDKQYLDLHKYRQSLRDLSKDKNFPNVELPKKPKFLQG